MQEIREDLQYDFREGFNLTFLLMRAVLSSNDPKIIKKWD